MAILTELGYKFPCTTEGQEIPLNDPELEMLAGDVVEAYFDADQDIKPADAYRCLEEVIKMKEQYPQFVLHYIKVETRRITVQYSVAPEGAQGSGIVVVLIILGILALVGIFGFLAIQASVRGYWWYPVGWAAISVKDTDTEHGISGVKVYADGAYAGTTDGYVVNKKLRTGPHIFSADLIEGYYIAYQATGIVNLNETTPVTVYLRPEGSVEPETGFVDIYTSPSGAEISIDGGTDAYTSPCSVELLKGEHSVGFGDIEGYITPAAVPVTVVPGKHVLLSVRYEPIEEAPWQRYLAYGLTAAAIIAGAALAVPPIIKALKSKEER
jgi:hypothetical protein